MVTYFSARPWFELWAGRHTRDIVFSLIFDAREGKQEEWPGERFQCSLAFAYLGGFEDGSTVLFGRGPSRAEALDTFRGLLTEEEFYAVETAAVPQYIRSQSAADLQQVVRSGSFEERVLALTWLTLVGYNDSSESPFAVALNRISGGPAHAILEEVYPDRALLLDAHRRLGMAETLCQANGPPPLAISGATLGQPRRGWRTITYMVPDEVVDGSDNWPAAIDPRSME